MKRSNLTKRTLAAGLIAVGLLTVQGCTPEERALATGMAIGGIAGAAIASDHPRYYDRPYYYYRGRYYYGGYYRHGYYYFRGRRLRGGHYYHHGYRYYNGRRYRAVPGRYGYYPSRRYYERYRRGEYYR